MMKMAGSNSCGAAHDDGSGGTSAAGLNYASNNTSICGRAGLG
jgi:hypothetical protein